jgi:hypothetical protein
MVMKAVKLDEKVIAIALLYGKSVNMGILSMQRLITETVGKCVEFEGKEERKHNEILEAISNLRVTIEGNQEVTCNQKVTPTVTPKVTSPFTPGSTFRTKYKDKVYDIKSDKNGDYIIDGLQMKRIVREGKVVE